MIRRVVCLCFLLQIWNSHPGVLGTKNDGINTKNESFNTDAWELVQADNEPIASLSDLSDGVFSLQLSAVQSDCETEYLGFNNRTCSTALSPKSTSGPVMRGPSKSMMWREWLIRVQEDRNESKIVSLQAFVHPEAEKEAKCHGFVSTFYGSPEYRGTCVIRPYGNGLFLNASEDQSSDSSQMWTIRSVDGEEGAFELIASNKPGVCRRLLAVEDCQYQPKLIFEDSASDFTSSIKHRDWKIVKRYDLVPKTSPPPPPLLPSPPPAIPVSPPPPPSSIPGPVISAPSSTSSRYVEVRVDQFGGGNRCSVTTIVITSMGSTIGSTAQTVEVSVSRPGLNTAGVAVPLSGVGYNSIYAIGRCSSGESTERSNGLSVYYYASGGTTPQVADSVLFSLRYVGVDASSFDNQANKDLVCANIGRVQPGGICQILSILPGSAVVTGTVTYPSSQDAANLVQQLSITPLPQPTIQTLKGGTWSQVNAPTGVQTLAAEQDPLPPIPGTPDPPTSVGMTQYNGDCPTAALDVSFTPPADRTGILAYTATCKPSLAGPYSTTPSQLTATVVQTGSSTTLIRVTPLTPQTQYVCEVQSITVDEVSSTAVSSAAVETGCTSPSPSPQQATAATISSAQVKSCSETTAVTVTWSPGADSIPAAENPSFYVTCISSGSCPVSPTFDLIRPSASTTTDVTGLSPGTQYDCYVVAKSGYGANVCSTKSTVTTSTPNWYNVGSAGFSAGPAGYTSLALDSANTPYVAYADGGNSNKATVMEYDGSSWVVVGSAGFSAGVVDFTSLALDSENTPYVAYADGGDDYKATVMKYDGSSWVVVGSAGFSAGLAVYTSLALDSANTPYVAYADGGNSNKATVMEYDGSSWVVVGSAGFSAGLAVYTSLALDSENTPYVAYADGGDDYKATVMKYDGISWVVVGSAGFSAGPAVYTSLALDSENTPYVAYADGGNSNKATVMKYDGSSWVVVGSAGFSAGVVDFTSLALDSANTPYVAYADGGDDYIATVMKYDGSSWVVVGSAGFSAGPAYFTSLAVDSANTPYVAYGDGRNSNKATVMKYV